MKSWVEKTVLDCSTNLSVSPAKASEEKFKTSHTSAIRFESSKFILVAKDASIQRLRAHHFMPFRSSRGRASQEVRKNRNSATTGASKTRHDRYHSCNSCSTFGSAPDWVNTAINPFSTHQSNGRRTDIGTEERKNSGGATGDRTQVFWLCARVL